jgi:aminomethyltransferase
MSDALLRTPLNDEHEALGGKMVPFAGYSMPVQYPSGIRAEHQAVREAAGLFDVSHMGEFFVTGPDAVDFVQSITVNDAAAIEVGQAQYSAMCREDGGILDDLIIYRFPDRFLLVVNASNREKDWAWCQKHAAGFDVHLEDRSDEYGLMALQGPRSSGILSRVTDTDLEAIGYYRFAEGQVAGVDCIIARTGYTGEDGFELYVGADQAPAVWSAVLEAGADQGLIPAGLGARDSLRLEVGYALYGNDLDEDHTPLESALAWITKLDGADFVGREAIQAQKDAGIPTRLTGLRLSERGFPRAGYPVVHGGEEVGIVTSGVLSPSLGEGVALVRVRADLAKAGTELAVRIRDKDIAGVTQRPQFYTEGSIRR